MTIRKEYGPGSGRGHRKYPMLAANLLLGLSSSSLSLSPALAGGLEAYGSPSRHPHAHPVDLNSRRPPLPVSASGMMTAPNGPFLPRQGLPVSRIQMRREQSFVMPVPVFARFRVPGEGRITFFSANGTPFSFQQEAMVGLKSRHRYAFALDRLPGAAGRTYYGTIEILRGPIHPAEVKASDIAMPVPFDETDIEAIKLERMVTKIITLEDPKTAIPAQGAEGETVRHDATLIGDAISMAKEIGPIMMAVRIGSRVPTQEELTGSTVPGSLVIPRELTVTDASGKERRVADGFVYPETGGQVVETVAGWTRHHHSRPPLAHATSSATPATSNSIPGVSCPPKGADNASDCRGANGPFAAGAMPFEHLLAEEEYLCDGGDRGREVVFAPGGGLMNLDPADTVAEFRDGLGHAGIAVSNVVCFFAPRYAEVRLIQAAEGYYNRRIVSRVERDLRLATNVTIEAERERTQIHQPVVARMRERASQFVNREGVAEFREVRVLEGLESLQIWAELGKTVGPRGVTGIQEPMIQRKVEYAQTLTRIQFPQVMGMTEGVGELVSTKGISELSRVEEKPLKPGVLQLTKTASVTSADIGDIVTFTIRYENIGEAVVNNIAVVDSLVSRLDYVVESALSSRDAVLIVQDNDVGSQVLRWEVKESLRRGESGTVSFKARVR